MKKIVELVDMSFKNSQEYFKKSIDIQHLKADFIETLSAEQKQLFDNLLDSIYKLHRLDNEKNMLFTPTIFVKRFLS